MIDIKKPVITIQLIKNNFDEYEVQYLENGVKNEAKTYYTDDHDDAVGTKNLLMTQLGLLR